MTAKSLIERKISDSDLALSKARGVAENNIDALIKILEQNKGQNSHDVEFIAQSFAEIISAMSHVNAVNHARIQFESLLLSFD